MGKGQDGGKSERKGKGKEKKGKEWRQPGQPNLGNVSYETWEACGDRSAGWEEEPDQSVPLASSSGGIKSSRSSERTSPF